MYTASNTLPTTGLLILTVPGMIPGIDNAVLMCGWLTHVRMIYTDLQPSVRTALERHGDCGLLSLIQADMTDTRNAINSTPDPLTAVEQ